MRDILGKPIVVKLYKSSFIDRLQKLLTSCLVQALIIGATLAVITAIVRECGG